MANRYSIKVGGIDLIFNSREDLDDALMGFVEPSLDQIAKVDRELRREGVCLTLETIEGNIRNAFRLDRETTGSAYYREPIG